MLEIRGLDSSESWESAVQVAPRATLFHKRVWLDFLTRVHRLEIFLGGVYADTDLVGVFPICTRRRGPFHLAGSPYHSGTVTPYMGPAVPDELLVPTLEAFERWQQDRGIDYAELTLDWKADHAIWDRFQYTHRYLHTVWLQVPSQKEPLWNGLSKSCRGAIRKAESDGVEVEEVFNRTFFETYLDMAADVYSRYRRPPPYALEFYQALWDALRPCETIRVLVARRKQEVVASAIFLMHREVGRAYYIDGVSYLRHRQLYASNLIQWTMLQELAQNGFEVYDMVGADHAGIRRFKLSFGGLLRAHDYVYRARTPWARIAREGYRLTAPVGRFVKYYLAYGHKHSRTAPTLPAKSPERRVFSACCF